MNQAEIEKKILELKAKQSDYFKKKKADRDPATVNAIREELNALKKEAKGIYRPEKVKA